MALTVNGSGGGTPVGTPTIETGSYTGTGTYGSTNENSITFNRTPVFVMITCNSGMYSNQGTTDYAIIFPGFGYSTTHTHYSNKDSFYRLYTTLSGTTLSFYYSSAPLQMNESGADYNYFAITI